MYYDVMPYYRLVWNSAIKFKQKHLRINFEAADLAQEGCLQFDDIARNYGRKYEDGLISCEFTTFLVNALNYHFLNISHNDLNSVIDYTADPEKVAETPTYDVNFQQPIIASLSDKAKSLFIILIGANEAFQNYLLSTASNITFQRKVCSFLDIKQKEYIQLEKTVEKGIKENLV